MTDVSIIIPTRNEKGCISSALSRVAIQMETAELSYEVLVIDDASNDGTTGVVSAFSRKNSRIKLVCHPPPRSFGYSVRDGIKLAKGKLCVLMMADLSDDPKFIFQMWREFSAGADVVCGSRFIKGASLCDYPFLKMLSNRLFNSAVMLFLLPDITDASNNFKAFRVSKARTIHLQSRGFEVGAELLLRLAQKGCTIVEIPVSWTDRSSGKAKFRLSRAFLSYLYLFLKLFASRLIS